MTSTIAKIDCLFPVCIINALEEKITLQKNFFTITSRNGYLNAMEFKATKNWTAFILNFNKLLQCNYVLKLSKAIYLFAFKFRIYIYTNKHCFSILKKVQC